MCKTDILGANDSITFGGLNLALSIHVYPGLPLKITTNMNYTVLGANDDESTSEMIELHFLRSTMGTSASQNCAYYSFQNPMF